MTLMEMYAPGTFCWADLGTPDAQAATRFYTQLFGWDSVDRPLGPDVFYTMFSIGGRPVAALYRQDAQSEPAAPPHWLSYISVEGAATTVQRARELGGHVLDEAFDVLDVGRMAVIRDPIGAVVALWEPKRHIGAGVVGEPGTPCWNELVTTDPESAVAFYTGLLEWECVSHPMGSIRYTRCRRGGSFAGGMRRAGAVDGPSLPHWLLYFAVENCEAAAAKAASIGGRIVVSPAEVPELGRCAVLEDPQEAVFAIIELLPARAVHQG
ncbi:MAG TPA: VOC family protein [Gemmatimonadales bacterium]|jgi:predicted enzyme related to lactoylglutathione lyase|nr:VOC family protein [Gemmatimonadales bacterium]